MKRTSSGTSSIKRTRSGVTSFTVFCESQASKDRKKRTAYEDYLNKTRRKCSDNEDGTT